MSETTTRVEHLVAESVTNDEANRLRSAILRNVKNAWVYVMSTRNSGCYDVLLANEHGGSPSNELKATAKDVVSSFKFSQVIDELRDTWYEVSNDEITFE